MRHGYSEGPPKPPYPPLLLTKKLLVWELWWNVTFIPPVFFFVKVLHRQQQF